MGECLPRYILFIEYIVLNQLDPIYTKIDQFNFVFKESCCLCVLSLHEFEMCYGCVLMYQFKK